MLTFLNSLPLIQNMEPHQYIQRNFGALYIKILRKTIMEYRLLKHMVKLLVKIRPMCSTLTLNQCLLVNQIKYLTKVL